MRASDGELLAARFWSRVRIRTGCWEWQGARNAHGYGRITIHGQSQLAHRVSWALAFVSVPEATQVLHHCDNPPCVRPDHLFLGNPQINYDDARAKGRARPGFRLTPDQRAAIPRQRGADHWSHRHPEKVRRGADAHRAKLTEDKVRDIRRLSAEGWTLARLSAEFGVRMSTLSYVIRRETWRHIP